MMRTASTARTATAVASRMVLPRTTFALMPRRSAVPSHNLRIAQLRRMVQWASAEQKADTTVKTEVKQNAAMSHCSSDIPAEVVTQVTKRLLQGLVACFAIFTMWKSVAIVPANSTGILDYFGDVAEEPLMPGLHFVNPLSHVHIFSLRTQKVQAELSCPSKEGLRVKVEGAVLFHVEPKGVRELYLNVGADWAEVIMEPRVNSAVRTVCSGHEAKDLYGSQRMSMQSELEKALYDSLVKYGIIVENCLLKNVTLPTSVAQEIEAKLQAEERSHRMQHVLQGERQEAERKAIEAKGIADFQRIVAEGVSKELLQWKGIEATAELAKSTNAKVVLIGNPRDGLPLVLGGVSQA